MNKVETTYSQKHKSMDCPICGKPLIESVVYDKVVCSDFYCKFNMDIHMRILGIDISNGNDFTAHKNSDGHCWVEENKEIKNE